VTPRRLSDKQVAKEARLIEDEEGWPNWPVLPVKNIYRRDTGEQDLGIITAKAGSARPERTVYLTNLLALKTGKLGPQLEGLPSETYASTEEMVRAGWIGD